MYKTKTHSKLVKNKSHSCTSLKTGYFSGSSRCIKDNDIELEKYFCADHDIMQDILGKIKTSNEIDLRPMVDNSFKIRTIHDIERDSKFNQAFLEFIIYNIGIMAVIAAIITLIKMTGPIQILLPFILVLITLISRTFYFILCKR